MALDLSDKEIYDWLKQQTEEISDVATGMGGNLIRLFSGNKETDLPSSIPILRDMPPEYDVSGEGVDASIEDPVVDFVKRVLQGVPSNTEQTPEGYYYPKTTAVSTWEELTNQRPGYVEKKGVPSIPQVDEPSNIFDTLAESSPKEEEEFKLQFNPEVVPMGLDISTEGTWSDSFVDKSGITPQAGGLPPKPTSPPIEKKLDLEALVGPQEPPRDYITELTKLASKYNIDPNQLPTFKPKKETMGEAIGNLGQLMGYALAGGNPRELEAKNEVRKMHYEAIEMKYIDAARQLLVAGKDREASAAMKGWDMMRQEKDATERKEFEYYNMIGQKQPGIWKQPKFVAAIAKSWGVDLKRAASALQSLVDPTTGLLPDLGITKYEEWTNMKKTQDAYMEENLQKAGYTPEMISEFRNKGKFDPDSFWKDQMVLAQGDPVKTANVKAAYGRYLEMSKLSKDVERAELYKMLKVLPKWIQDPKALKYAELSFLNHMMGIKGNIPASVFTDTEVKTAEQLMLPFVQSGMDVIMGVPGAQEIWNSRFLKLGVDPPSPMIVSKYLMETVSDQDLMKFDIKIGYGLSRLPPSTRKAFTDQIASGGTVSGGYKYLTDIYNKDVKPYSDELARWEKEAKVSIPAEERERILEGIMRVGKMPNKVQFINELKMGVGKGT
jgi:hypothetical protein